MPEKIVLKSFTELADALELAESITSPADDQYEPDLPSPEPIVLMTDPATWLAELEHASATLANIAQRDQETRSLALRDLEHYDQVVAALQHAEQALERARQVLRAAEELVTQGFAEEARAGARRVVEIAVQAETAASQMVEQRREEVELLAQQMDLERLLAERQRQEEAEKTKAAEADRARRLSGALAQAKSALDAGRLEEAKALLGPLADENPDDADVASLTEIMRSRELAVKVSAAEDALWMARREVRHDPAVAVERLQALDVAGLPEEVARQVFGEWARACSRLCRERSLTEPLRYAPDPGRGAVVARERPGEPYTVVSALGLGPAWQQGAPVDDRQVRRARPLR